MLSATAQGAALLAFETTWQGQTIKIMEGIELEKEIMQCLSKQFSLTYRNPSINSLFTSQVGFLVEKAGTDKKLEDIILKGLGLDDEAK